MKRKKIYITIISIILILILLFSGTWIYCYYAVWKPHIPTNISKLEIDKNSSARRTYYRTPDDEKNRQFTLSLPWFGNFHCVCSYTSGINFDDNNFIINENGEKEIIPTAISGSDYFFSILLPVTMTGKIKQIVCNVQPVSSNKKYAESAYFEMSLDGSLKNKEMYNQKELALYNDSLPEILEITDLMKEQFKFT